MASMDTDTPTEQMNQLDVKAPPTADTDTSKPKVAGPRRNIRIGILLTEIRAEQKKEELIPMRDKNRPWALFATKQNSIRRLYKKTKHIKLPKDKHESIPADVSSGLYIEWAYGCYGVTVDLIKPEELSVERAKKNDINFLLIYDLLEAYHTDKTEGRKLYTAFRDILESCDNIYPSYEYQKFINSKIIYYNYLKEHKINIAGTVTLTPEEYAAKYDGDATKAAKDIMKQMKAEDFWKFIAKPVYGQESIALYEGFVGWPEANGWIPPKEYKKEQKKFAKYLEGCMAKYPGCVMQKFIEGFGDEKKSPELRMYYIGDEYKYSMCTSEDSYLRPKEEGGRTNFPTAMLREHTEAILPKLPPIIVKGKKMPRLLTRFDMGYLDNGKPVTPFVNEVEFVPSLYIEEHPYLTDKMLGDQMVHIACELVGTTIEELAQANESEE